MTVRDRAWQPFGGLQGVAEPGFVGPPDVQARARRGPEKWAEGDSGGSWRLDGQPISPVRSATIRHFREGEPAPFVRNVAPAIRYTLGELLDQFATNNETISNFVRTQLGALGLPCQFGGNLRDATVITDPGPSRAEVR